MKKMVFSLATLLCGVTALRAAEPVSPKAFAETTSSSAPVVEPSKFTWGGDIRLRTSYFDNIPYNLNAVPEARGGVNSYQRYRTRIWSEYQASEELKLRLRLVNEFRTQQEGRNAYNPLDEIVIDNLYFDWAPTPDWSVRVGRQDLIYGTGKLILDGTPKDGSRTIYFDAIKASYTGWDKTTIDLLGIYTRSKDPLAMHSEDRDINGKASSSYEGAEAGGGIYIKNNSREKLPLEAYYLLKSNEEAWTSPATGIVHDDRERHTVGIRLMPKISDHVDANIELAYQFGDEISAYMIDSLVNYHFNDELKSCLGVGWYHLSGDDPGTTADEGWNPLWARWPQFSELYVYGYDTEGAGRWSNISMPHVDFTFHPTDKLKTSLVLGYMLAPETDSANGGGNRGFIATLWNRFTIRENLINEGDKLTGHVVLEAMDPGDYYSEAQQNHTALFGRVELNYSF